jgi:hypothetical protein
MKGRVRRDEYPDVEKGSVASFCTFLLYRGYFDLPLVSKIERLSCERLREK